MRLKQVDLQAVGREGRRGQAGELQRPVPRVTGDDGTGLLGAGGLLAVNGQAVRGLGDRPGVHGGRSELGHFPATASGAERDLLPEQVFQRAEVARVDCRGDVVEVPTVRRLLEPVGQVLRRRGRQMFRGDRLLHILQGMPEFFFTVGHHSVPRCRALSSLSCDVRNVRGPGVGGRWRTSLVECEMYHIEFVSNTSPCAVRTGRTGPTMRPIEGPSRHSRHCNDCIAFAYRRPNSRSAFALK